MQNEIRILNAIDYETYRFGFAPDKSQIDCKVPLNYFSSTIRNFEKLAVGRFFWFIIDFPNEKHCASGGDVDNLTPFGKKEFSTMDHFKLHDATHPDDLPKVNAFSRFWIELCQRYGLKVMCDFNMSLYFRMKNALGDYYWMMVQYPAIILDTNSKIQYGLVLVTDLSHVKVYGEPMMNILNQKEHSCQQFYCSDEYKLSQNEFTTTRLTIREKEVLRLMAQGHGSKQIASMLHISTKTVDNHRQNMLHKTGSKSSSELVSTGIRLGMV